MSLSAGDVHPAFVQPVTLFVVEEADGNATWLKAVVPG